MGIHGAVRSLIIIRPFSSFYYRHSLPVKLPSVYTFQMYRLLMSGLRHTRTFQTKNAYYILLGFKFPEKENNVCFSSHTHFSLLACCEQPHFSIESELGLDDTAECAGHFLLLLRGTFHSAAEHLYLIFLPRNMIYCYSLG